MKQWIYEDWKGGGSARKGNESSFEALAMTRTDNPLGSVYLEYNIYLNANQ